MRNPLLTALLWLAAGAGLAAGVAQTQAQSDDDPPPERPRSNETIQFERLGAQYGARQYRRGRWGLVGIDVANLSDQEQTVLAQIAFESSGSLFHARRIWTPPDSIRRTWTTIQMPRQTTTDKRQDLFCQLIADEGGAANVKARQGARRQHRNSLRLTNEPVVTGVIVPLEEYQTGLQMDPGYEMVIAARGAEALGRQVVMVGDRYLPQIPEAYDAVDQLVLYNDRFAEEPVGCAAIRSWLHAGGHIWIQLDRVSVASVERLLGERFRGEEVDRVDLHELEVVSLDPRRGMDYTGSRRFEAAIPFVRLAVEDVQVTHEVNGWPASFVIQYGRGRVVVTTVGGSAWVAEATGERNLAREGRFSALAELSELDLIATRRMTPANPEALSDYLESNIGYRIVGRSTVVLTLFVFCLFLVMCGGVLMFRGGLERMTWIAPCAAIAASAPLIWLGLQAQTSAPPSIAMAQYVQIADASSHAHVSGAMAMYRPEPGPVTIGAERGGIFQPDWQGLENSIRRMVRTDVDQWRWEDIRVTSGIRKSTIEQQITLPSVVEARGSFDQSGFRGVHSGLEPLEDVLIVSPSRPAMAVRREGEFIVSTTADQLADDQYVVGTLLTDEQRRRQEVYQQLFAASTQDAPFPGNRMVLGWAKPFDLGFHLPDDSHVVGGALVATSLVIDRPESGSDMRIPSPFQNFKSTTSPDGLGGGSPLYNTRTGEWITSKSPTKAWLLVQPPSELLPATIRRATVRLKCTIPSRVLTLSAAKGKERVQLMTKRNAIGPLEFVIDDPQLLTLDENGGFRLGLSVSEATNEDPEIELRWNVDYLDVELEATVD